MPLFFTDHFISYLLLYRISISCSSELNLKWNKAQDSWDTVSIDIDIVIVVELHVLQISFQLFQDVFRIILSEAVVKFVHFVT